MSQREHWTLQELGARVALALSVAPAGTLDGRTRDIPDARTIRYYTSLGLVSRPAAMRGRTALYGRRHLAQVVAIKRLQARGLSLAEIQKTLAGILEEDLDRIADVPREALAPAQEEQPDAETIGAEVLEEEPSAPARKRRGRSFWTESPAEGRGEAGIPPVTARAPRPPAPAASAPPAGAFGPVETDSTSALPLTGVALGPGVTLLIGSERRLQLDDLQAVAAAAAPLLKVLASRRLVPARSEEGKEE